jgi:hypothetical protein
MSVPLDPRRVAAVKRRIDGLEALAAYHRRQAAVADAQVLQLRKTWGIDPPCPCEGNCIAEMSSEPDEDRLCPHYGS